MTFTDTANLCVRFCQNVPDEMLDEFNKQSVGVMTLLGLLEDMEWAGWFANADHAAIPCCPVCFGSDHAHNESCLLKQILDIHRKHGED